MCYLKHIKRLMIMDKNANVMLPMLATHYDKSRVKLPCLVQAKIDGVRAIICLIGSEVHILSRTGKEYNVPHLKEWAEGHKDLLPLDGEIYNHNELTFQQICSAVKCYSHMTDKLKYVIYDKPIEMLSNKERWASILFSMENRYDCIELCQTAICNTYEEIERWHDYFVQKGYEGAIIRNMDGIYIEGRSNDLMKLKKFDTTEFEISDVLEAAGKDKGTAIFLLKSGGHTFQARPCGSKSLRAKYLLEKTELIGKMCTVQHFGYTDGGIIPRFPVALTIRDY